MEPEPLAHRFDRDDPRAPLAAVLAAYAASHPSERGVAERIAGLVVSRPDCFDRSCRPGHITGSAWVVSADRSLCLLLHHRKLGRWLQPGGHADGDPDPAAVALREAQEETGLVSLRLVSPAPFDLDVHTIPARRDPSGAIVEDAHEHHDLRYLFEADPAESLTASDESHAVGWFTVEEARLATDDPSVLRLLAKGLAPRAC